MVKALDWADSAGDGWTASLGLSAAQSAGIWQISVCLKGQQRSLISSQLEGHNADPQPVNE